MTKKGCLPALIFALSEVEKQRRLLGPHAFTLESDKIRAGARLTSSPSKVKISERARPALTLSLSKVENKAPPDCRFVLLAKMTGKGWAGALIFPLSKVEE